MYNSSQKWKDNIYDNVQAVLNVYVDDVLVNPNFILDLKFGGNLFDEELILGSVPSRYLEIKFHKKAGLNNPKVIRVEYGILINHALTLAEFCQLTIGELQGIKIKSISNNDKSFEMMPIGVFNVDSYENEDDNTFTIKALDNMIKFEFNYDGSKLNYPCSVKSVLEDICLKAGVELGSTSFLNMNAQVAVYDNSISARTYLSYIAEQAGGFACIGRDGKLYIKSIYQDEAEIELRLFKTYKFGEEYKISKVCYEDGIQDYKFGNNTRNTLWINQENMYIVDEEQIEAIYEEVGGLTANSFEGTAIIDPALDIGDKITIGGKAVIYQGEMTLAGNRFIADIRSRINIKQKEETMAKKVSQKVINRRVEGRIDQAEGKISQIVEEQTETTSKLTQHEQTMDSITQSVTAIKDNTVENVVNGDFKNDFDNWTTSSSGIMEIQTINNTKWLYMNVYAMDVPDYIQQKITTLIENTQYRLAFNAYHAENSEGIINASIEFYNSSDVLLNEIGTSFYLSTSEQSYNWEFSTPAAFDYAVLKLWAIGYPDKKIYLKDVSVIGGALWQRVTELQLSVDGMSSEVSKKVGNNEIISKINQSAEAIKIAADNIDINGTVSANRNFRINTDGTMECTGAKISVQGTESGSATSNMEVKDENYTNRLYSDGIMIAGNSVTNYGGVMINPNFLWVENTEGYKFDFSITNEGRIVWIIEDSSGKLLTTSDTQFTLYSPGENTKLWLGSNGAYINGYKIQTNSSDKRLKENIQDSRESALDKIMQIQHRSFIWKENGKEQKNGYIAQELEQIDKEFVIYENDKYSIDVLNVLSTATKAVQEQQKEILELKAMIQELKEKEME